MKIEALGGASLNSIPVLNNRQLTSDVTIPADGTALLASESSNTSEHARHRRPPRPQRNPRLPGHRKTVEKDTAELLITLTPHIVRKRSSMVASRRLSPTSAGRAVELRNNACRVDPHPTTPWLYLQRQGGSSSVVECFLAKEDVAGSTPVSRSKHLPSAIHSSSNSPGACVTGCRPMRRGTQVVRERSAKPLCVGSIPTRASTL